MKIKETCKEIYKVMESKGWWEEEPSALEVHALVHSEVAEATESFRNGEDSVWFNTDGKPEGEAIELADAVIRIMNYFTHRGWDLEEAITLKMKYNKTRPYRHGNKKA